ncbi:G-D-S-L family lipolytic protein [Aquimarina sp. U1-2]|uniref:G-D-S-L family lipolytic protein n=1 Tax=Aquimarina sp. U1-2 TaxID=2823141 RepID=UPI001AECEFE2|nr:G-D-S-L family lipolytic protein [Aquimarina sp. U1-2]MBP2831344.1 G-D-S-L family lipolytic protein [Aquimarina sp. U1-2]
MKKIKYILLSLITIGFMSCENDTLEDLRNRGQEEPVELETFTQGSADFSTYVSLGNSLTAGFADGTLYKIAQENSTPSILAQQFAALGNGGTFTQPLMNDNVGGLLAGGTQLPGFGPRLALNLDPNLPRPTPVPLQSLVPSAVSTTDIVLNNPTGPFNNLGVPGAKSFHLLAPGYGDVNGVFANPPTANPYFVRMTGTTPNTSVIELAIAQQPSFISLWIGNNDVLGYALSGGDGSNPITPIAGAPGVGFEATYQAIVGSLTANISGVQGILGNIPNVTAIPHFTTVPHNPVPLDAATANAVNQAYAQYNGGLQLALTNSLITAEEATARTINFEASMTNAVVIIDEDLTDLSGLGLPNYRQATKDDLLVLPASSFIGTLDDPQNPSSINGVAVPLSDRWVLTPQEQNEIEAATIAFNTIIEAVATANGFALFDANALLDQVASTGVATNGLIIRSDLVTGGAFSLDGVHPTSRGYALIANEMLKAIDVTYGSNFEASGNLVDVAAYNTNYSPALLE